MKFGLPLTNVRESSTKTLVVRAIKAELMPMQRSMRVWRRNDATTNPIGTTISSSAFVYR